MHYRYTLLQPGKPGQQTTIETTAETWATLDEAAAAAEQAQSTSTVIDWDNTKIFNAPQDYAFGYIFGGRPQRRSRKAIIAVHPADDDQRQVLNSWQTATSAATSAASAILRLQYGSAAS